MRAIALALLFFLAAGCASASFETRLVERVRNGDDRGEKVELFRAAPFARGLEPGDCAALYRSTMSAVDFVCVAAPATVDIVEPVASASAGLDRANADAGLSSGDSDAATAGAGLEGDAAGAGSVADTDSGGRSSATAEGSAESSADTASHGASEASGSGSASSATGSNAAASAEAGSGSTSAGGSGDSSEASGSRASGSAEASRGAASNQGSRGASSAEGSGSSETAEAGSGSGAESSSAETIWNRARAEAEAAAARFQGDESAATTQSGVKIARRDARADEPFLVITKTANPSTAFFGDEVVFLIRVRNDSALEIEKILVVDHLDGWFEFEDLDEGDEIEVSGAPGGTGTILVFEIDETLEPGETWTTMVTVSVRRPAGRR